MQWGRERVVVTGGAGFLGRPLVERLRAAGCGRISIPRSKDCDLVEMRNIERLLDEAKPTIVIHLAARVGGIGANRAHPGQLFYDNLMMGVQLIEACRRKGVRKFVGVATICAYPNHAKTPFSEDDLWNGYPEQTNAPYGLAKKMLLVQAQAYRAEYGFSGVVLFPVNLYGPGDNFDLETSHVIPAIIRKCSEARDRGEGEVVLWGDGSPTREFLYVDDAAEGILRATEKYDGGEPVNLGTGMEISIFDLATRIADLVGFDGKIVWDKTKPNGQPRRRLDVTRAERLFGFRAKTPFEDGLRKTFQWYRDKRKSLNAR